MIKNLEYVDEVIKSRNYPFFGLHNEAGERLVPYKRFLKNDVTSYLKHWQFIKHKLINELPNGKYILECFYDLGKKNKFDYTLEKVDGDNNETVDLTLLKDGNKLQKEKNSFMTEKEHIEIIKENERLKAEKGVLIMEVQILQKEKAELTEYVAELESELEETESLNDGNTGGLMGGIQSVLPVITPLLEKYMELQERSINVQEQRLNRKPMFNKKFPTKSPSANQRQAQPQPQDNMEPEQDYNMILSELQAKNVNDPQAVDDYLDTIEHSNPELYDQLIMDLGLLEDDETENQNE